MPFIDQQGASIYYETWGEGSGPWVTLLNGRSRSSADFKAMARYLNERSWRVLLIDNRGAGKTESPLGFSIEDSARDVVSLWDHLGIAGSALLGISYGGILAMHVALLTASRVTRLLLISTTCRTREVHGSTDMDQYFSEEFVAGHELMVRAFAKEMARAFQDPHLSGKASAQGKAMEGVDISHQLSRIQVPTLVIHGDKDRIVSVEEGRLLARTIPRAKLEEFSGAGHLLLAETPKRLYDRVWEFCVRDPE